MAKWLNKVFDSGVRKGLELAEERVQKEVKKATEISPKNLYSKARKEFNKGVDKEEMYGENTKFPKGMVPIGDKGFFASPSDGTFDPRDCSNPRNSTSPFCGYNPISPKPLNLGVDFNVNDCGGYISIKPTIGFIEFPPVYAGYLNPSCREDYKKENNKEAPPNKSVPPGLEVVAPPTDKFPPTPGSDPPKLGADCWYMVALGYAAIYPKARTESQRGTGFIPSETGGLLSVFPDNKSWSYASRGSTETYYKNGENSTSTAKPESLGEPSFSGNSYFWKGSTICGDGRDWRVTKNGYNRFYSGLDPREQRSNADDYTGWQKWGFSDVRKVQDATQFTEAPPWYSAKNAFRDSLEATWMTTQYNLYPAIKYKEFNTNTSQVGGEPDPNFFAGRGRDILRYFAESNWANTSFPDTSNKIKTSYFILEIYEFPCETSPAWNYPPFKDKCMSCCCDQPSNEKQRQDDEILRLLREIRKFIGDFPRKVEVYDDDPDTVERQKLSKTLPSISLSIEHFQKQVNHLMQWIGVEEFPVIYPDTVVKPVAMNGVEMLWDWLTPDKERKIQSLAQLLDWGFDQMSAVQGQWHQYLEYEDDKGKKQKISFPDMGTALRETIKMLSSTIQALGIQTDIELKTLQESTNSSLMIVEALKRITDIQDYLDYPTQQKAGSLPVGITPKKNIKNIKEYLQNSELKYQWDDWTPNQGQSLQEQLNDIMMILNTMRANQGGEF